MRGYILVPIEPTKEMIKAGQLAFLTDRLNRCSSIYKAMLGAAPVVKQVPAPNVAQLVEALERLSYVAQKRENVMGSPISLLMEREELQAAIKFAEATLADYRKWGKHDSQTPVTLKPGGVYVELQTSHLCKIIEVRNNTVRIWQYGGCSEGWYDISADDLKNKYRFIGRI